MNKTDSLISELEAMLFAAGDPVEASKLAEVLDIDIETVQNENTYYWRYCFKTGM